MKWLDGAGQLCKPSDALALEYNISGPKLKVDAHVQTGGCIVRRGPNGILFTDEEMLLYMLYDIAERFTFTVSSEGGEVIVLRNTRIDLSQSKSTALARLLIGRNQRMIAPPFFCATRERGTQLASPEPGMIELYHNLDAYRLNEYNSHRVVPGERVLADMLFENKIPLVTQLDTMVLRPLSESVPFIAQVSPLVVPDGVRWRRNEGQKVQTPVAIPSLQILAYEGFSYAQRSFYQTDHGPLVYHSAHDLHLKTSTMIRSFDQESHTMSDKTKSQLHLIPAALNRMVDLLDLHEHLGKYRWVLNPILAYDDRMTSGGERANHVQHYKTEFGTIKSSAIGTKAQNATFVQNSVLDFMESCRRGQPEFIDCNYKVVKKNEPQHASGAPGSCHKASLKCREYFIPFSSVISLERLLRLFVHLIFRGDTIRIGMSWFFGGAQKLWEHLYVDGGLADDGDFTKMDKTIKAILLSLHVTGGVMFLDFSKMAPDDVRMYKIALKILSYIRVTKVTRINGNIWVVVKGIMPSGVLETSDGDSWVVAFLICMFVEYVREQDPVAAAIIDKFFATHYRAAIYGDDHIKVMGRMLRKYLNENKFAAYVKEFWDMEIREIRTELELLAIIKNDAIVRDGAIFLKRFLIETPDYFPPSVSGRAMSTIVPWKPAYNHFARIPICDDGRPSWTRWILSIIGHAWDSMGTNITAYKELAFLFQITVEYLRLDRSRLRELIYEEITTVRNPIKIMKKLGLDITCFYDFPTLKLLMSYHVYDRTVTNKVDPTFAFGDRACLFSDLADLE